MISLTKIKKLPDAPGVYLFKNSSGKILYVGKATSLRDRVRSYLANDISETRGQLIVQMIDLAKKIDFIETDSVLEALILEANLIKKHQPPHNTKDKDDKSFNHVVISNEKFPRVFLARGREIEFSYSDSALYKAIYGPFPYGGSLRDAMKIIRRIFPYRDNRCIPAEELPAGKIPRPCFNSQIGLCPGVCTGKVSANEYAKTIRHLMLFFEGNKKKLLATLEREMKTYARNQEFEKAAKTRRTVFALKHIQDVALMYRDKGPGMSSLRTRIEAYDIAHLAGSSTVGVMTVVSEGVTEPAEYRMFRIRENTQGDDLRAISEVLKRRFTHSEWPQPTILVIDGGLTHLQHAEKILQEIGVSVKVVSVVKDASHKPKDVLGESEVVEKNKAGILLANNEAHRFALKYHKKLRNQNFLG